MVEIRWHDLLEKFKIILKLQISLLTLVMYLESARPSKIQILYITYMCQH